MFLSNFFYQNNLLLSLFYITYVDYKYNHSKTLYCLTYFSQNKIKILLILTTRSRTFPILLKNFKNLGSLLFVNEILYYKIVHLF
jgi:hypothetical protein